VIDATGAPASSDMTVVITGDRITELGRSQSVRVPEDARVIDATGKFLIPGLWDMHVHCDWQGFLPLFIANGVTGIRQMGGVPIQHQWRKEVVNGTRIAPRQFIGSPMIDGLKPQWSLAVAVTNGGEARNAVANAKEEGADFIKVYVKLSRESFFAIADETKKLGISFAGHIPILVSAAEASDAGQKSIEHLYGIPIACSSRETDLRAQVEHVNGQTEPNVLLSSQRFPAASSLFTHALYESFDEEKAAILFARFKRNHTWQCPTLTVLQGLAFAGQSSLQNDFRVKYFMGTGAWIPAQVRTPEDLALAEMVFEKQVQIVSAMHRAGLDILAGTDAPNPYCFYGFSLHDELALLVKAGLTPMQALQAATINPARFLDQEKNLGSVVTGKFADLVLLDANPLEDIANTKKISAVVVGGKVFSRSELDEMLTRVAANVQAIVKEREK
jgi:hypothetical protein